MSVTELLRHPGTQQRVRRGRAPLDGLALTAAQVPDGADVAVDGVLEALSDGRSRSPGR